MAVYQHILVATDLSPGSIAAAKKAKQLATLCAAKLSFIHIIEPLPVYAYTYIDSNNMEQQQIQEAQNNLTKLARELDATDSTLYLEVGYAKTEITRIAEEKGVDLIVVGSHLNHRFATLLGSTANAVTHAARCDVLILRHDET